MPGRRDLPRRRSRSDAIAVRGQSAGPAILAALAAGNTAFAEDAAGRASFHLGIEWIAVAVAVALIAWRGNVFLGILAAAVLVAVGRAVMVG